MLDLVVRIRLLPLLDENMVAFIQVKQRAGRNGDNQMTAALLGRGGNRGRRPINAAYKALRKPQ